MKKVLLVLPFALIALVLTHAQSAWPGTWQNEVLLVRRCGCGRWSSVRTGRV